MSLRNQIKHLEKTMYPGQRVSSACQKRLFVQGQNRQPQIEQIHDWIRNVHLESLSEVEPVFHNEGNISKKVQYLFYKKNIS